MEYLDFDLDIGEGNGLSYPLAVRSPAGEARETMSFPYNRDRMEMRLKDLTIALLRSASISRLNLPPELQSVKDMGADLFNALLTGDIRSRYDLSRRMAEEQGKGLRVRLRIQAPELSALPWEYLYDPRSCEYLCLSTSTPLVRYLEVSQVVRPISVDLPLRVLGMICAPTDLPALDVALEKRRVEEALAGLQKKGLVELTWLEGQTWSDLQDALLEGPWHVFHFIGHGGFDTPRDEGFLALAREDGTAHPLHATELARLLADHRELRVVVINACQGARSSWESIYSSTAAVLVRRGIACAVAMQFSVTDKAAVELARRFYTMLARGLPVDAALTEARKALSIAFDNSLEWGTPVLFMRSPDGLLFNPHAVQSRKPVEPDSERKKVRSGKEELQARAQAVLEEEKKRISEVIQPLRQGGASPEPTAKTSELPIPESVKGRVRREGDHLWVQLAPGVEMEFVRVPEGEFWMGSDPLKDKDAGKNEQPQHPVWLDEYWIGRYPVTNLQYAVFIQTAHRKAPESWKNNTIPAGKEDHPVVDVTWQDAAAFGEWAGLQLPTEAQWEKAARGTDGRIFAWGDADPDRDHCNIDGWYSGSTPVGKFSPLGDSPYGCADMTGNVWEWCADWYADDYYQQSPERNPPGPPSGSARALRGGSWGYSRYDARCAFRGGFGPDGFDYSIGFRFVWSNSPAPQPEVKSSVPAEVNAKKAQTSQTAPAKVAALPIPESVKGRARREGDHLWVQLAPGVEMEFVRVPEGEFWMGADPKQDLEATDYEQPRHKVWLDEYWIGRYPVTKDQYAAFIKTTGRKAPKDWKNGTVPTSKENHPVVYVSWEDAADFSSWCRLGLPTEAQWEKAARGTDGRIYPWGNDALNTGYCNIKNWYNGTTPVGQFSPNGDSPYGCADMIGNAWEWCSDWYQDRYYSNSSYQNPPGPEMGDARTMRGSSWSNMGRFARCSFRLRRNAGSLSDNYGFRLVVLSPQLAPVNAGPVISRVEEKPVKSPQITISDGEEKSTQVPSQRLPTLPIPESVKGRARREGDHLWVQLAPGVEMEFVRVPEGEFWMGSDLTKDKKATAEEQPRHKVWLDEYWIGRYPVTNGQYETYIKAMGKKAPHDWKGGLIPSDKQDHPVVYVSWQDAAVFGAWAGLQLPTEAQWEKAARGTDGRIFAWGNAEPDHAHCNIDRWYSGSTPVGKFSPLGDSPYGCADMTGNVFEWCADWYASDYYRQSPNRNPPGPASGNYHVARGGSWSDGRNLARCARRFGFEPDLFYGSLGFRLACSPSTSDL